VEWVGTVERARGVEEGKSTTARIVDPKPISGIQGNSVGHLKLSWPGPGTAKGAEIGSAGIEDADLLSLCFEHIDAALVVDGERAKVAEGGRPIIAATDGKLVFDAEDAYGGWRGRRGTGRNGNGEKEDG